MSASLDPFLSACDAGDVAALRDLLAQEPALATSRTPDGTTGLHRAVRHPDAVRLLLDHGADPDVREAGDNALPLHFAAGSGHIDAVRLLLQAGSDPQGVGDLHVMDTVGWATCFEAPRRDVVDLLVRHGARQHVFSATALGDVEALRAIVALEPAALTRRLSRFEQEQTVLHFCVAPADGLVGGTFRTGDHYRTLAALIELGVDLEARDAKGRTALEVAMLKGDREAMRLLYAAGAKVPEAGPAPTPVDAGADVRGVTPMIAVPDMPRTVAWYRAVGFELRGWNGEGDAMDWASLTLGGAEVMLTLSRGRDSGRLEAVSLWFRTDRLDELYAMFRHRVMAQAAAVLAGEVPEAPPIALSGDLYTAFYGQREFSLDDPNGVSLNFFQELEQDG